MRTATLIDYTFKFVHLALKHINTGKYLIHFFAALSFTFRQACYTRGQSLYVCDDLGYGRMQQLHGLVHKGSTQPTWVSLRQIQSLVAIPCAIALPDVCGVTTGGVGWDTVQDLGWSVEVRSHVVSQSLILMVIGIEWWQGLS